MSSDSVVVNSLICPGTVFTKDALLNTKAFPTNLVSTDSKWLTTGLKGITDEQKRTSIDGPEAACRWWYDDVAYGEGFCCQMYEFGTLETDENGNEIYTIIEIKPAAVTILPEDSLESADAVDLDANTRYTPGAMLYPNGAKEAIAATAAAVLAAITLS